MHSFFLVDDQLLIGLPFMIFFSKVAKTCPKGSKLRLFQSFSSLFKKFSIRTYTKLHICVYTILHKTAQSCTKLHKVAQMRIHKTTLYCTKLHKCVEKCTKLHKCAHAQNYTNVHICAIMCTFEKKWIQSSCFYFFISSLWDQFDWVYFQERRVVFFKILTECW